MKVRSWESVHPSHIRFSGVNSIWDNSKLFITHETRNLVAELRYKQRGRVCETRQDERRAVGHRPSSTLPNRPSRLQRSKHLSGAPLLSLIDVYDQLESTNCGPSRLSLRQSRASSLLKFEVVIVNKAEAPLAMSYFLRRTNSIFMKLLTKSLGQIVGLLKLGYLYSSCEQRFIDGSRR